MRTQAAPPASPSHSEGAISFLPGPVNVSPGVRAALSCPAQSHRGPPFVDDLELCKARLCTLVNGEHVEFLLGSGTLANDVIAGQLGGVGARGLVLTNGEFGDRLGDHARRMRLVFDTLDAPWGSPLPYDRMAQAASRTRYDWLWAVHCETSTGVLNDIDELKAVCRRFDIALVMDCISSIGAVPVDLADVRLASGVSGKAIASFAGLAMVFHRGAAVCGEGLPRYLDLAAYIDAPGVPYTMTSNLLAALNVALAEMLDGRSGGSSSADARWEKLTRAACMIRRRLTELDYDLVADESISSPAVISFRPPPGGNSVRLGERLEAAGVLAAYRSDYLVSRNVLQVCLMGELSTEDIEMLLCALETIGQDSRGAQRGAGHKQ